MHWWEFQWMLWNMPDYQEKIDDKRKLFDAMSGHGDIDEEIKM